MNALEQITRKKNSERTALEKAVLLAPDSIVQQAAEELLALEDVKSKAAIVIAGWELMSKTSDYDLDELKESLRKFAALC